VKQLIDRPVGELRLCAMLIDRTPCKNPRVIAALGKEPPS
jgi:hypothetical protein